MTGLKLKGIKPATNQEKTRLSRRQKTVYRAYGGVLSHKAVREKIVRAFLIEASEDSLPRIRWCPQPQGRQGEDCQGFLDRGTEDCYEGSQGPGKELIG